MKFLTILFTLLAAVLLSGAEVQIRLRPNPAVSGEPIELTLISSRAMPKLADFPETPGAKLRNSGVSTGYSTNIINGKRTTSFTAAYTLTAGEPGKYTLSGITAEVDKETIAVDPVSLEILDRKSAAEAQAKETASLVFGKFRIMSSRNQFYVGEEIPFQLDVYSRAGLRVQLSYPELRIPGAAFRDYRKENPDNSKFAPPRRAGRSEENGNLYDITALEGAFTPLQTGKLTPEAEMTVGIVQRRSRTSSFFDDDFFSFSGLGGEVVRRTVWFQGPGTLEILPLPPAPAGSYFSGLIGDFQIRFTLDHANSCRVGEVVTLRAELSGGISTEGLRAPELELPGFRVYPPEVKAGTPGNAVITWALIPLHPGKRAIDLKLTVFAPQDARYRIFSCAESLEVLPAERQVAPVTAQAQQPAAATQPESSAAAPIPPEEQALHYLLPAGKPWDPDRWFAPVLLPLLILIPGGPLLWGIAEWLSARRRNLQSDASMRRRHAARARKKELLRALAGAEKKEEWDDALRRIALPVLADLQDLPPGITAGELAETVADQDLASALRDCEDSSFRPGGSTWDPQRKEAVIRILKKMLIVLLSFHFCGTLFAGDHTAAAASYDRSDFPAAMQSFRQMLDAASAPDAGTLYNYGCSAFMNGDLPLARAAFEEAHLLAPWDPQITANLDLTRSRLGVAPVDTVDSPEGLVRHLRNQLRPDQWALAGAVVWFAFFLLLIFRKALGRHGVLIAGGCAAVLILLAAAAVTSELAGPWHPGRAIVRSGGAEMRQLPGAGGNVESRLRAGIEVRILEKRGDFLLILDQGRRGWVDAAHLLRLRF
ncbi:MAG: BatD family protein [Lentisphaeria bacterium]|nr:BatD family protein [Lentisphaeria bacterium]